MDAAVLVVLTLVFFGFKPAYLFAGIFYGVLGVIELLVFGADAKLHFMHSPLANPQFLVVIAIYTIGGFYYLWRYFSWKTKRYEAPGTMSSPPGSEPPTLSQ